MPIPNIIDALRTLAPLSNGGETLLLEAAEHLEQLLRQMRSMQEDPRLPLTVPQR